MSGDFVTSQNMGMLTDLYELTMSASYFRQKKNEESTFDLFVRHLPPNRSLLVSAGLEQVLYYLQHLSFGEESIQYLRTLKLFEEDFLSYLRHFRFTGEVWAMEEGQIFFPQEPLIRVTAPLIQAQLVETFLLNTINYQSMVASKTARIILAADGKSVVDFSPRRDHGCDAALKAARASFIAGCVGTSNVLAGQFYSIPVYGTMAHSYVMSYPDELTAFRSFITDFPDNSILLIDTYDTLNGAKIAVTVAKEMEQKGQKLRGVRLDSGDLNFLSRKVREILDSNGFPYVKILASGDLNEWRIAELTRANCPIDFWGVGTQLGTSADAPYLGGVYKLVDRDGRPTIKLSQGKLTLPGKKQVYRCLNSQGQFLKDIIALQDEPIPTRNSFPLLHKVMENGEIIGNIPSLQNLQKRFYENLSRFPPEVKSIHTQAHYPVELAPELQRLCRTLVQEYSV